MPPVGVEPGSATKLQILATELWSLLATRSPTYTGSLARVSMCLAILSGAVIALALVAQADHFGSDPRATVPFAEGVATVPHDTP